MFTGVPEEQRALFPFCHAFQNFPGDRGGGGEIR